MGLIVAKTSTNAVLCMCVCVDMVKVIFERTLLRGRPTWLLEKGFQENHLIMHGVGVPKHMRHYERIRQKRFCAMVVEQSLTSRKDWWDTYKRRGVNSGGHSFRDVCQKEKRENVWILNKGNGGLGGFTSHSFCNLIKCFWHDKTCFAIGGKWYLISLITLS